MMSLTTVSLVTIGFRDATVLGFVPCYGVTHKATMHLQPTPQQTPMFVIRGNPKKFLPAPTSTPQQFAFRADDAMVLRIELDGLVERLKTVAAIDGRRHRSRFACRPSWQRP
jgi:hypothetical protein